MNWNEGEMYGPGGEELEELGDGEGEESRDEREVERRRPVRRRLRIPRWICCPDRILHFLTTNKNQSQNKEKHPIDCLDLIQNTFKSSYTLSLEKWWEMSKKGSHIGPMRFWIVAPIWGLGLTLTNVKVAYSVGKKLSQGIIFYALWWKKCWVIPMSKSM